MSGHRRVVVTGLGIAAPIGIGIDRLWEALIEKRCGIRRIEAFDASGMAAQVGGELPDFSFSDYIPKTYRKSAKVMARDIAIALICAYHAVKDAGLVTRCIIGRDEHRGPANVDSTRFGANIGAGLICADLTELAGAMSTAADPQGRFSLKQWGAEGMFNLTPLWLLKFLPNMLACHVTIVHDAQAPSNTITCGEASSHLAIGEAFRTIRRGAADVCICGGAESKINPMAMVRPQLWKRLNVDSNAAPERASRPFAADAAGMAAAEGGGLIILEELAHARARGARIYAEVAGFAAASNITSWKEPDPGGRGLALAVRKVLKEAGAEPKSIDLLCLQGTGIQAFDRAEAAALEAVFGDALSTRHAVTTRGSVGNCGAGLGAIDFATAAMSVYQNVVPPSLNTSPLAPNCRLRFVMNEPVDAPVRQALTAGYALAGGQNGALVLRKYKE